MHCLEHFCPTPITAIRININYRILLSFASVKVPIKKGETATFQMMIWITTIYFRVSPKVFIHPERTKTSRKKLVTFLKK